MATTDPAWIDHTGGVPAYNGQELRRMHRMWMYPGGNSRAYGARPGVHPAVLQGVTLAGTTVTVGNQVCVLPPPSGTAAHSPYVAEIDFTTYPVAAADAVNPRIDLIIARVWDDTVDSSGLRKADSAYVTGTAAPVPTAPAVPNGAIRLATINVPATPGAPTLTYDAQWTVANGGILPVRTAAELPADTQYSGQMVWRQDLLELQVWDGGAWVAVGQKPKAWTSYTPSITGGGAATFSTNSGVWKYVGTDQDMVYFNIHAEVSVAGTGSSNVLFTAPTSIDRNRRQVITGHFEYPGSSPASPKLRVVQLVSFTGGSGSTWDRTRFSTTGGLANLIGSDLHSGSLITFSGTYRKS